MPIEVPSSWGAIASRLVETGGVALMLGARDTGKSTLATWLAASTAARGRETWLVDADVGQSDLGPPGCIGAARVPGSLLDALSHLEAGQSLAVDHLSATHLWFVGSHSPQGRLLDCVLGTERLVREAVSQGAQVVVVNTTGWVEGATAAALKTAKVDLLRPRFLVAVEKGGELEGLLAPWQHSSHLQVLRVQAATAVVPRAQGRREEARCVRWAAYLAHAHELEIDLRTVGVSGAPPDWPRNPCALGRAVGLVTPAGECAGAGPLVAVSDLEPVVRILAPVAPSQRIARLQVGLLDVPGHSPLPCTPVPEAANEMFEKS